MSQSARRPIEREELIVKLRGVLPWLRESYGVSKLWLFGSYARGTARQRSDVDLLVEFEHVPTLFRFIELEQNLSDLFGVKVDLVMKTALKPAIGRRILSEVIQI